MQTFLFTFYSPLVERHTIQIAPKSMFNILNFNFRNNYKVLFTYDTTHPCFYYSLSASGSFCSILKIWFIFDNPHSKLNFKAYKDRGMCQGKLSLFTSLWCLCEVETSKETEIQRTQTESDLDRGFVLTPFPPPSIR